MSEHTHGPECGHPHHTHQPPHATAGTLPRGVWIAAIAAVAGIGLYALHRYGKKSEQPPDRPSEPADWQQRVRDQKSELNVPPNHCHKTFTC